MDNETCIRIMKFRQFKQEIRGSKDYLIVGIDVAKDKHYAFLGDANGKTLLRKLIFENNLEGFTKLISKSESIKYQNGFTKIVYGLEPTSNYHKPLGMHLVRNDCEVVLVSGISVRRNRELLNGRWDKNDTKCAANVADLISQGKCLFYESPSSQIHAIRSLLSLRERMKKEYHSLRMRIRNNLLAKYFPEFDKYFGKNLNESLPIVKWCLNPDKIASMEFNDFMRQVTTQNRNKAQEKRLREIHRLSMGSIGCHVDRFAEFEAGILVNQVELKKQIINRIDDEIDQAASVFTEYHCLLTIPGFGPYVSALVLAKIGDPFRFENRYQLIKMAGFDLSAKRSGKSSDKSIPVISKKGSNALRYALYQAALVSSSRNSHFIEYFTNKLKGREKERGIRIKMRVKLASKLLVIAWTLMKRKIDFDPSFLLKE